jgi:hypothetical protein
MNSRLLILAPLLVAAPALLAQSGSPTAAAAPASGRFEGPPVVQALPRATPPVPQPGQQRVYVPAGGDVLIARQTADGILAGFKKAYNKDDHAPRVVIYVNRALVDPSARQPASAALADQQTVRDVERLFGRAFRNAGATLADQKVAASLLPDEAGSRLVGDQAAKDREALARIADIAIEVLISSRNLTVPEVSGDSTYAVPDIQATAIRLKDSAIVGQASASDILGKGVQAGRVIRQFDVRDITEATAIALMEDMLTGTK